MSIEKTVSEIAEILGVSRQAVNNRVKQLPEEDLEKNAKGVTVVKRSGLIKLEEIYKKTIFDDEPIDEETKQRELLEILVDEKNSEIARLYAQLKAKDEQLSNMDDQLRVKDVQIAEKDKQIDQQQQLAMLFGVQSIPSLLFIPKDGKPQMSVGAMGKADFKKAIADVLKVE